MNVAIWGASDKPDRYSHKALKMLLEKKHRPFPVHPVLTDIDGQPVYAKLSDITEPMHTVTVYLSAENSRKSSADLMAVQVKRVIFNPGAENPALAAELRASGIEVVEACTLVMLATGQF